MEHPYSSCVWEFTLVKELEELKASNHAVGSCCCLGGRREKWHSFFGDLLSLPSHLPGHDDLESYEVVELPDGRSSLPHF